MSPLAHLSFILIVYTLTNVHCQPSDKALPTNNVYFTQFNIQLPPLSPTGATPDVTVPLPTVPLSPAHVVPPAPPLSPVHQPPLSLPAETLAPVVIPPSVAPADAPLLDSGSIPPTVDVPLRAADSTTSSLYSRVCRPFAKAAEIAVLFGNSASTTYYHYVHIENVHKRNMAREEVVSAVSNNAKSGNNNYESNHLQSLEPFFESHFSWGRDVVFNASAKVKAEDNDLHRRLDLVSSNCRQHVALPALDLITSICTNTSFIDVLFSEMGYASSLVPQHAAMFHRCPGAITAPISWNGVVCAFSTGTNIYNAFLGFKSFFQWYSEPSISVDRCGAIKHQIRAWIDNLSDPLSMATSPWNERVSQCMKQYKNPKDIIHCAKREWKIFHFDIICPLRRKKSLG